MTQIGPIWRHRDVVSGYWRLYRNSRSGAWVDHGQGRQAIPAEQIVLVPAWSRFDCGTDTPGMQLYFHFEVLSLTPALTRRLFPGMVVLPETSPVGQIVMSVGDRLDEVRLGDPVPFHRAKAAVFLAIAEAWEMAEAVSGPLGPRLQLSESPIGPAVAYIEQHLHEPIRVADLAACCHYSEGHLTRLFREHAGVVPSRYLQEQRVSAAARRLAFTDESLESIADACGFPDRFYLTRIFKQHMQVPPAHYRQRCMDMRAAV